MKLIRKADGTLEIEGTPEEVRALLAPVDAAGTMLVQYPPLPPQPSVPTVYTVRAGSGWVHNNAAAACAPTTFFGQTWVGTIKPFSAWPAAAAGAAAWCGGWGSWS